MQLTAGAAPRPRHPVGFIRGARLHGQAGFTILELMVVVAILGVLSISVLAIYQDLTGKARQAADDGTLGALRSGVALFIAGKGYPPPDQATLDTLVTPSPPTFLFYAGYNYDPVNGQVTAQP